MEIVGVCVHIMHLCEFFYVEGSYLKKKYVKLQILCLCCNVYVLRWKNGHKILHGSFDFCLAISIVS